MSRYMPRHSLSDRAIVELLGHRDDEIKQLRAELAAMVIAINEARAQVDDLTRERDAMRGHLIDVTRALEVLRIEYQAVIGPKPSEVSS